VSIPEEDHTAAQCVKNHFAVLSTLKTIAEPIQAISPRDVLYRVYGVFLEGSRN
jgi:hypothetical protein